MSNNRFWSTTRNARTRYHERKLNALTIDAPELSWTVVFHLAMNMHLSVRYQADQPRNPKYEEDIIYVTKHNKWVLNSIGMWPAVLEGIGKFVPKIVIGLSNFVSFFSVVQCVLHIILEEKDPLLRLRLLGLACYSSTNLMKYWALILRKPNIEYCIEQIQRDWKQVSQTNICKMLSGKVKNSIGYSY